MTDDERETHLPAPSLWPIGFAIGVACVLVGLVVSVPAQIVGAINALVFGFQWVRDTAVPATPVISAPAGSAATSNASSLVISGSCVTGNSVNLAGSSTASATCASSAFSFTVNKSSDASPVWWLGKIRGCGGFPGSLRDARSGWRPG